MLTKVYLVYLVGTVQPPRLAYVRRVGAGTYVCGWVGTTQGIATTPPVLCTGHNLRAALLGWVQPLLGGTCTLQAI